MRGMIGSVLVLVSMGFFTVAAAQLPPEILLDSYMRQVQQAVRDGDLAGAQAAIDKILDLQNEQEMDLPDEFHFRYAQVAAAADLPEQALESIMTCLAAAGRDAPHYVEALELMNKAQAEIEERTAAAFRQTATTQAAMDFGDDSSTSASQDGVAGMSCAEWNTQAYFETATVEDVTACLDAGADPAATNDAGVTPLHWAAFRNPNPAAIEALIAAGAILNVRDEEGVMGTNPSEFSGCGQFPVETVSWNDAQEFIGSLNGRAGGNRYRLPDRGGVGVRGAGGDDGGPLWEHRRDRVARRQQRGSHASGGSEGAECMGASRHAGERSCRGTGTGQRGTSTGNPPRLRDGPTIPWTRDTVQQQRALWRVERSGVLSSGSIRLWLETECRRSSRWRG